LNGVGSYAVTKVKKKCQLLFLTFMKDAIFNIKFFLKKLLC